MGDARLVSGHELLQPPYDDANHRILSFLRSRTWRWDPIQFLDVGWSGWLLLRGPARPTSTAPRRKRFSSAHPARPGERRRRAGAVPLWRKDSRVWEPLSRHVRRDLSLATLPSPDEARLGGAHAISGMVRGAECGHRHRDDSLSTACPRRDCMTYFGAIPRGESRGLQLKAQLRHASPARDHPSRLSGSLRVVLSLHIGQVLLPPQGGPYDGG